MKLPLKVLIHSIFWLVFLSVTISYSYISEAKPFTASNLMPHIVINTIWGITIFYVFYFYFIIYFEKREFIKYLLYSIILSIAITFLFLPFHKVFLPEFNVFRYKNFGPPIVGSFVIAQCGCLIKGFENWFKNIRIKAELENRNLKNELELLKSQINPHFLFNTLNNIDTLIHKAPDDASRTLISLSDMMRYMIYETNTDYVPLEKELEYIRHYINLQKLRFKEPQFIKHSLPNNCQNIKIAPLLLLPFIENAFKHASSQGKLPGIEININCYNHLLAFQCKNQFNEDSQSSSHSGGVGLENVKRRLELIYSDRYELHISKNNGIFTIELKLELS